MCNLTLLCILNPSILAYSFLDDALPHLSHSAAVSSGRVNERLPVYSFSDILHAPRGMCFLEYDMDLGKQKNEVSSHTLEERNPSP